ncbi:protein SRG1-like [Oryza brachyantha]|uniref:protein SRG1-like n=1 Tax=Oryza brachyantha TaxID=4533 RepID=UPI001AD966B2|nr:protein SRG1-like [Oryza brachyantha]
MDSAAAAVCAEKASETIKIGQVDDVQELHTVPERYIRDGDDRPNGGAEVCALEIPVIDVGELRRGGEEELDKLRLACKQWGFFQVVNHGVEEEVMEEMEKAAREFFMLPLEEKEKYPMEPGGIQGYGHAFVFSEDQKLDWCNMLALGVEPAFIRRPNLWPTTPANFSGTLETYSVEIRELCLRLLDHIAAALGLAPGRFNGMFGEAVQAVRMNFYPPCPRPELVLGLSPHSDGSAVTVLQQDAAFAGLQVLRDGAWVPVQPVPGALVVNIGDTLEVLTNGRYKSVEHRAVASGEHDRLSVVTFYAPAYDVELGPMPEFVAGGEPCRYRRYNHGEYSRHYVTSRLEGKKTLEFAKI